MLPGPSGNLFEKPGADVALGDPFGHERIVQMVPDVSLRTHPVSTTQIGVGIGVLALFLILMFIVRMIKRKRAKAAQMNNIQP